jgi:hypothetical protein
VYGDIDNTDGHTLLVVVQLRAQNDLGRCHGGLDDETLRTA